MTTDMPYIIPIIDIDGLELNKVLKKISEFNEIIQLINNSLPIYYDQNFLKNISQPVIHKFLRQDLITLLEIIFNNPEHTWSHENNDIVETIQQLKRFFLPFRGTTALLFESGTGNFDWEFLKKEGNSIPVHFFECMHILFGIQCFIPNAGFLKKGNSPLTATLTNHQTHFSIGNQYLLTRSDGNCFFHVYCQLITGVFLTKKMRDQNIDHLVDLTYKYAVNQKNDNLVRYLHSTSSPKNLFKLLKILFENHVHSKDISKLEKPQMLDITAFLISEFFKISIREHHINAFGQTYLKKTHGDSLMWSIDVFHYLNDVYISDKALGQWKIINSYQDYLSALVLLWQPSFEHLQTASHTLSF